MVVVEDNEAFAKYLRYLLEHGGAYQVLITGCAEDAVRLAGEPETGAVILDVSLRDAQYRGRYVDGLELARILKSTPATRDVPIAIVTAHAMAGDRERFLLASGADAFFRKPLVDPSELLRMLAILIERRHEPNADH